MRSPSPKRRVPHPKRCRPRLPHLPRWILPLRPLMRARGLPPQTASLPSVLPLLIPPQTPDSPRTLRSPNLHRRFPPGQRQHILRQNFPPMFPLRPILCRIRNFRRHFPQPPPPGAKRRPLPFLPLTWTHPPTNPRPNAPTLPPPRHCPRRGSACPARLPVTGTTIPSPRKSPSRRSPTRVAWTISIVGTHTGQMRCEKNSAVHFRPRPLQFRPVSARTTSSNARNKSSASCPAPSPRSKNPLHLTLRALFMRN